MRVRVGQLPYKRELLTLTKVSPVTIGEWIREGDTTSRRGGGAGTRRGPTASGRSQGRRRRGGLPGIHAHSAGCEDLDRLQKAARGAAHDALQESSQRPRYATYWSEESGGSDQESEEGISTSPRPRGTATSTGPRRGRRTARFFDIPLGRSPTTSLDSLIRS